MKIGSKRITTNQTHRKRFPICDLYDILAQDIESINVYVPVLFWYVQTSCLIGEGRRDWEERLRYGVKMNYMHYYIGIA